MRRSRLVQVLGGAVMAAALLLPSTALAATANPAAGATTATPATATSPSIKLACSFVVQNPLGPAAPRRANVCTWEAPAGVAVRTYRLWRVADAPRPGTRRLIATFAAALPLRYGDRAIRSGHAYTYYVAAIGADGKRVAISNRVTIHVGRAIEKLGMICAPATVGDLSGISCRWSAAKRPAAARYVLLRSVDGAARERIYTTWKHGRRSLLDTDVKPGQVIRYAVLALSSGGRVVSLGGPVVVTVPDASAATR